MCIVNNLILRPYSGNNHISNDKILSRILFFSNAFVSTRSTIESLNEVNHGDPSELRSGEAQPAAQETFRRPQRHRPEACSALHCRGDQLDLSQQKDSHDATAERHRSFRQCLASQTATQSEETSHREHLSSLSEEFFLEAIHYS